MREQDPRVPAEVESYLIGLYARAGQAGGGLGGAAGGGTAGGLGGAAGGARGGARGARRLKTVVEDRTGVASEQADGLIARVGQAFPRAEVLAADDHMIRFAIPVGRTGLQHVVADITLDYRRSPEQRTAPPGGVLVRAYGKEGILNRKPTARTADAVLNLLAS